ncbi:MAG: DUF5654 family protein [Candidatus Micrarchaeaceae archaeon]
MARNINGKVRSEMHNLSSTTIEKVSALIISAFGFVAALAWNNAIQKVISIFLSTSSEVTGLLVYAVVVTVIAVVITVYLTRLSQKVGAKS